MEFSARYQLLYLDINITGNLSITLIDRPTVFLINPLSILLTCLLYRVESFKRPLQMDPH